MRAVAIPLCMVRARSILALFASIALLSCASSPPATDTLYADLGGNDGLTKIINGMLVEIAGDTRIRHHFESLHIAGFRDRLTTHFCQITGGPCSFDGRSMRQSHRLLNISRADFNALVEDLIVAMDKLEVERGTQNRFLARLAALQPDIVSSSGNE